MFCSIWCNVNKKWSEEINIEEWGWKLSKKGIEPIWTTLAEASQSCKELIKCNTAELIAWTVAVTKSKIWNVLSYVDAVEDVTRKWNDMLFILLWKWFYKKITHNSYLFCWILFILIRVFRNDYFIRLNIYGSVLVTHIDHGTGIIVTSKTSSAN